MDDLWGDDDLDADVVEECVLLATQASYCSSPKPQLQRQQHSFIESKPKYGFEFKLPSGSHPPKINITNQKTAPMAHTSTESNTNSNINVAAKLVDVAELELLKEENRRLCETNLIKNGETTILRTDLQSVRAAMEKREIEVCQQLASLKEKVIHMDTQYSKQLEASKTEMKFKELELEELRNKCKRIEQSAKEHQKNKRLPTTAQESPNRRKFLNRSSFEMAKYDAKSDTIETGIQTDPIKRFRLDSTGTERMDNATDTSILIETLKFSLLSSMYNNAISYSTVMERLKQRMISGDVQENLIDLYHRSEPGIAEMICSNLERVKNADILKSNIEFLCCWISHILPFVENPKQGRLIEVLLSEIRRTSFTDLMSLLSAIVARFGLAIVCNRPSGCLLEKAALNLKDSYLSLNSEDQFQAAQKLVLTISTMLASPASENCTIM